MRWRSWWSSRPSCGSRPPSGTCSPSGPSSERGRSLVPVYAAERAPFSREFPGLAPGEDARLSIDQLRETVGSLGSARLGLAVAHRPADVLPVIGWTAPDMEYPDTLSIAAVLRSWEDRFGARLVQIGPGAEIKLLVERPPRTLETAQAVAAEHYALCDESQGGLRSVPEISQAVLGAPLWTLWWD